MHIVSPLRCNGIVQIRRKTTWQTFPFVTKFGLKNTFFTVKNTIFSTVWKWFGCIWLLCMYLTVNLYSNVLLKYISKLLSWVVVRGRELSIFSATLQMGRSLAKVETFNKMLPTPCTSRVQNIYNDNWIYIAPKYQRMQGA